MKFSTLSWLGALLIVPTSAVEIATDVSNLGSISLLSSESRHAGKPTSISQASSCVQMILDSFDEAHTSGIKVELEIETISDGGLTAEGGLESLQTVRFDSGRFHSILSIETQSGIINNSESIYIDNLFYTFVSDISSEWFVVESPMTISQLQEQFSQFQNPEGISNCQVIEATAMDGMETNLIEFDQNEAFSDDTEDYSETYDHQVRLWLRPDGLPHRAEVTSTGVIEESGERTETTAEAVHTYDYNADFEIVPPI